MTEDELLNTLAKKNKTTPEEVRRDMQEMIDDIWYKNDGSEDTEEFKKLRLLIGHKPSIMEFVNYCAGAVEKEKERKRESRPWFLRWL